MIFVQLMNVDKTKQQQFINPISLIDQIAIANKTKINLDSVPGTAFHKCDSSKQV